jgi:glycerol-1-phosphate dehydrogenase [NAD(P)+]
LTDDDEGDIRPSGANDGQPEDFRKFKHMELPREVVVGYNAVERTREVVRRLGLTRKCLIVEDPITQEIIGERIESELGEDGIECDHHIIEESSHEEAMAVMEKLSIGGFGFVVGAGGGRPIDVAKLSSFNAKMPFLSFPTAVSHDGIISATASLTEEGVKKSYKAHSPLALVADTCIIGESPYRLLASGCGDTISNLSAVMDWKLAHQKVGEEYSQYATTLANLTPEMLILKADVIAGGGQEAAWTVCKALVSSGVSMSIAGSSRPASGSEHLISHMLDALAPGAALHGEQVAVGTLISLTLFEKDKLRERVRDFLQIIKVPTTAEGLGIDDDTLVRAVVEARSFRKERYTIVQEDGGITEEKARKACEEAGVIG